jgi:hypothetical protein
VGKIASGHLEGVPYPTKKPDYSDYLDKNFALLPHACPATCTCAKVVGCGHHWIWRAKTAPQLSEVDHQLHYFRAFRGVESSIASTRRGAPNPQTKQDVFRRAYHEVANKVQPFHDKTIVCDLAAESVSKLYDDVSRLLGGTVLTTKALHFFAPDLFPILDRKQVYPVYRSELASLPRKIEDVDGSHYFNLMQYIRGEVFILIAEGIPARTANVNNVRIVNLAQFRSLNPRVTSLGQHLPRDAVCILVDHIMSR